VKRIITLSILAVTCIVIDSAAQRYNYYPKTDYRKYLMFGLKGGVNYSNVYDTRGNSFTSDAKFGYAAGVFMAVPIGKYFGIQPEILYSQKGFTGKGTLLGSSYELARTTSFIDIPLFFSIKPAKCVALVAGPQFSYLLTQTDVFTNSSTTVQQEQVFKNDNIRKNILCAVGGVDFNFNHLVLSARAGWDLKTNNGDNTSITPRYKNAWLQTTVGVRF
jgi:hypothetical protein